MRSISACNCSAVSGRLPLIFELLRVAQIVFDFRFQLRLRHHRIERRLAIGALFRPDAVTPVNFFNQLADKLLGLQTSESLERDSSALEIGRTPEVLHTGSNMWLRRREARSERIR